MNSNQLNTSMYNVRYFDFTYTGSINVVNQSSNKNQFSVKKEKGGDT